MCFSYGATDRPQHWSTDWRYATHDFLLKKALLAVPNAVFLFKKIPDRSLFLLVLSMAPKSSEMKELGSELDFVFYQKCFGWIFLPLELRKRKAHHSRLALFGRLQLIFQWSKVLIRTARRAIFKDGQEEAGGGAKNVAEECNNNPLWRERPRGKEEGLKTLLRSAAWWWAPPDPHTHQNSNNMRVRYGCEVDSCTRNKVVFRKQRLKAPSSSVELVLVRHRMMIFNV